MPGGNDTEWMRYRGPRSMLALVRGLRVPVPQRLQVPLDVPTRVLQQVLVDRPFAFDGHEFLALALGQQAAAELDGDVGTAGAGQDDVRGGSVCGQRGDRHEARVVEPARLQRLDVLPDTFLERDPVVRITGLDLQAGEDLSWEDTDVALHGDRAVARAGPCVHDQHQVRARRLTLGRHLGPDRRPGVPALGVEGLE
jgi:hypothetical protein